MNLWEGRFTFSFINSQALLDEAAVLACIAYVDLYSPTERPIRAKWLTSQKPQITPVFNAE
jgi:hypothetical protein